MGLISQLSAMTVVTRRAFLVPNWPVIRRRDLCDEKCACGRHSASRNWVKIKSAKPAKMCAGKPNQNPK